MDASPRTSSCILPVGNSPAGHICICHEKSCFHQPLELISIPDTDNASQKTLSPRPLLENLVKSSILGLASLLVAWLSHVAKPGCSKWCLTNVFSLSVSRAKHGKPSGLFSLLHENLEYEALTLNTSLLQRVSQYHGKLLLLEENIKTSSLLPQPWACRSQRRSFSRSQAQSWWIQEDHHISQSFPIPITPQLGPLRVAKGMVSARIFLSLLPTYIVPAWLSFLPSFF